MNTVMQEKTNEQGIPVVSVICVTYNHEKWVRDALEGIINQRTNFPFEVIVRDDASEDGTAQIIREYQSRFPDIIFPIIENENQFSNGISGIRKGLAFARGRYIALCEGDDYWIDPNKLQIQFDFLETHPNYSACIHNAIIYDYSNNCIYLSEPNTGDDKTKDFEQVVLEGGGQINPTASFFWRKDSMDDWERGPVGDHFMLMQLASRGPIRWISTPMSVYRCGIRNSWTSKQSSKGVDELLSYHESYICALKRTIERYPWENPEPIVQRIQYHIKCENDLLYKEELRRRGAILSLVKPIGNSRWREVAYILSCKSRRIHSWLLHLRRCAISARNKTLRAWSIKSND